MSVVLGGPLAVDENVSGAKRVGRADALAVERQVAGFDP
jgi:hypothetical protein